MFESRTALADDPQERVLRSYTTLRLLRADWGGALILCCGLGPQGAALAMAANIAGAACLGVEEKPELLRAALRSGSCDFIVNTLDEALRAMKNEVRKHLPVSVGLQGSRDSVLHECVERGVQPEAVIDLAETTASSRASMERLRERGATQIRVEEGDSLLNKFVQERGWKLQSFRADDTAALRAFDARALELLAEDDLLRRQWLRSASRIVQRQRPLHRVLWLTDAERQALEA